MHFEKSFFTLLYSADTTDYLLLGLSIALFPVNWLLEAIKWKLLVRSIEHLSIWKAYSGILTGVSFGFITPHGLGDYIGRLLQMENKERFKAFGAVFMSRISQFAITLLMGAIGSAYFFYHANPSVVLPESVWLILMWAANIFMLLCFLKYQEILQLISRWKLIHFIYPYIEIIGKYTQSEILYVLLISLCRYLVFAAQFVLLLLFFKVDQHWMLLSMGVCFIFLAKSVIPTFFELGVREYFALFFFGAFTLHHENVLYACLSLWLINILVPALIGAFMVFRLHFFVKEEA